MSSEELEKTSTVDRSEGTSADKSVLCESISDNSVENKTDSQLSDNKKEAEKEPIDWFSVFLIVLVLANIGYWLATRNRNVGPDMRVFLASPAEQTFPIGEDKKLPSHGMLPPEVKSQAVSSLAQAKDEPNQLERSRGAEPAPERGAASESAATTLQNEVSGGSTNGEFAGQNKDSRAQVFDVASEPKGQTVLEDMPDQEQFLASEELPQAPFAPYFKGKPLEVSTAYKSGVSHEIKRDFLVNQYMYAAEVLDRYRADTKPIFDCDANAQKFSVSGDNEAELRAVQQTIRVSADLLRKTYNNEIAKALAKTKLKGSALEQAKKDAHEAEALLEVSFSRSAEKYEDVLHRLKAQ